MSAFTEFVGHPAVGRTSIAGVAADAVMAALRALLARRRESRAIAHLESLNDHHLRDIGITRSEVALVVRGADIDRLRGRHVLD